MSRKNFEIKPILLFTFISYCVFLICISFTIAPRTISITLSLGRLLAFALSYVHFLVVLFLIRQNLFHIFSHIFSLIGKVSAFEAASYWFKSIKVSKFSYFCFYFLILLLFLIITFLAFACADLRPFIFFLTPGYSCKFLYYEFCI